MENTTRVSAPFRHSSTKTSKSSKDKDASKKSVVKSAKEKATKAKCDLFRSGHQRRLIFQEQFQWGLVESSGLKSTHIGIIYGHSIKI